MGSPNKSYPISASWGWRMQARISELGWAGWIGVPPEGP